VKTIFILVRKEGRAMNQERQAGGGAAGCGNKAVRFWQQGDVLLVRCDALPEGVKRVDPQPLAVGEVTGHAHRVRLEDVQADKVEFFSKFGRLYVRAKEPITIMHEEHKTITIPPGIYERKTVREYDHFREETRYVCD